MRVIIAGGTGFIGRHLSSYFREKGIEVVVVSRNPGRGIPYSDVHRFIDEETIIVNLAGENIASGRWTERRKALILRSRVDVGKILVEEIEKSGTRPLVFLQASAVGYYGISEDAEFTEDSPPGNDFLADVAIEWENSTKELEDMGVRRVILRFGVVLGRDGGAYPRLSLPFRLGLGGFLGNGRQWMSWIHIVDAVRSIEFLMLREEASGPFNITSPNPVRNREFSRTLCDVLGKPCLFRTPSFLIRLALGEMADYLLLSGQRVLPARLLDMGFEFRFPYIREALKELEGAG